MDMVLLLYIINKYIPIRIVLFTSSHKKWVSKLASSILNRPKET